MDTVETTDFGDTEKPQRQIGEPRASARNPADVEMPAAAELTPREQEVLLLMADGMTNREIAEHLFLAEGTVKLHLHRVYTKLDAGNRVQAVSKAQSLGIIPRPGPESHT